MELLLIDFKRVVLRPKCRLVEFTILQLLQHNVQLGAAIKFSLLSSHWFVYGVRQNFAIISLFKTIVLYRVFLDVVRLSVLRRQRILFVNERRFTTAIVSNLAVSIGEAYIAGRWIGGSLTNFKRLWLMYHRALRLQPRNVLSRFQLNLKTSLRGLYLLRSFPGVIFFNSVSNSHWGTGESYAMFVPSAGIADTDSYPHSVMFTIPGNDDAFGSVYFLNLLIAKVVVLSKMRLIVKLYAKFIAGIRWWKRRAKRLLRRKKFRKKNRRNFRVNRMKRHWRRR